MKRLFIGFAILIFLSTCKKPDEPKPAPVITPSLSVNKSSLVLKPGQQFKLKAKVSPDSTTRISYTSSNTGIATVDTSGNITAVSIGSTIINISTKDGLLAQKCSLDVKYIMKVTIFGTDGLPVSDAEIASFHADKSFLSGTTNTAGSYTFLYSVIRPVTILGVSKNYKGVIVSNKSTSMDSIGISFSDNTYGSILALLGSCNIPNLTGRLSPIRDNYDRTYLYADNIAINGGLQQPVTFDGINFLQLADANSVQKNVWIPFINGQTSLLNYQPK